MTTLVVTGTGTEVGKTVTTAALAAIAVSQGKKVAVFKPAQTGIEVDGIGDIDEITRLVYGSFTAAELIRYPHPLAPSAAAREASMPFLKLEQIADTARELEETHDLVLIEGAGGLLVPFDEDDLTIASVASELAAKVVLVTGPALGTLNLTALTFEALATRGLQCAGLIIGMWPTNPDLVFSSNYLDLKRIAEKNNTSLIGALPEQMSKLSPADFLEAAKSVIGTRAEL